MVKPWTTLDSRTVVDDRWLKVRADRVLTGQGRVLDPFYVIERASWAVMVALTDDRQVVLTREYRHGAGLVAAGLPSGVVEAGETPLEAAMRELEEETGYRCRRWSDLGSLYANWRNQPNTLQVLVGLGAEPRGAQALDEGEDIAVELMGWPQWAGQVLRPPTQAYYVAATLMAERWLADEGV